MCACTIVCACCRTADMSHFPLTALWVPGIYWLQAPSEPSQFPELPTHICRISNAQGRHLIHIEDVDKYEATIQNKI